MVVKYRLICNNIRISKLYELRCCSGHYTWYQIIIFDLRFESSVISYGSKTHFAVIAGRTEFESSVISYGSKTITIFFSS